ncbi:WD40 repeat domain-containing protein [Nocardia asteroides]
MVSDYSVEFLAVSANGRLLAAAGAGVLQLWDVSDRAKPVRIQLPAMEIVPVGALAFSPDGRLLAVGRDSEVVLLDVSTALDPRVVSSVDVLASIGTGVPVDVTAVAFANDAPTMAVGYTNGLVGVWDVRDAGAPRSRTGAWTASTGAVARLGLSPDASLIATSEMGGTSLFFLAGGDARLVAHVDSSAGPAASSASLWNAGFSTFAPDGRSAVTIVGRTVVWWDVTTADAPKETLRFTVDHTGGINYGALSANGRWLATSGDNGQVILWDNTYASRPQRLPMLLGELGTDASKVAFAQRRPVVAVAAGDTVALWSLESAGPVPNGHVRRSGNVIGAMALSPDGRILAVGGQDGNTTLWNIDNLAEPRLIGSPLTDFVNAVRVITFSPDGKLLAVTGHPAMMLWDVGEPERPKRLSSKPVGQHSTTAALAFSPDGRTVAAARDRDVVLYDVDDVTRPISELRGIRQTTRHLMFSSDGRTLATGGNNPGVLLWDVTDRTRPAQLGQPLPGYPDSVRHLALAPDGRTLVAVADTARLWDLTDRSRPRPLGPPMETGGPVRPVAFAPDGHTLGIGTADHAIALWDLRRLDELRDDPLRVACQRMSSVLDEATWSFYAPGLGYHEGCGQ